MFRLHAQPFFLALIAGACAHGSGGPEPRRAPINLAAAESSYAVVRDLRDRIDVTLAAGASATADGTPLTRAVGRYDSLRQVLTAALAGVDSTSLAGDDARALGVMRATLARDLGPLRTDAPHAAVGGAGELEPPSDCSDKNLSAATNLDSLRTRMYACYGWAQSHVVFGADT